MPRKHTLAEFARDLAMDAAAVNIQNEVVLTLIGSETADAVRQLIRDGGAGQHGFGIQWPALKQTTIDWKAQHSGGYLGNAASILYDSGDFYNDVSFEVNARSVMIGTNQEYIQYTEYGTSHMEPRPVFPTALLNTLPMILSQLGSFYLLRLQGNPFRGRKFTKSFS
jgi:phage gpG-like protein